ncbi:MAG: thioesterase II family protein [Pyrinomonadaceae bacterium]
MTTTKVATPWLTPFKQNQHAQMRLFCFPYAGGGAHIYRDWIDSLPASIEVCPIQLPGRGARMMEAPFTQMSSLVPALTEALLPYLDKPFACFGHSMGALVSFEFARQLRSQNGPKPIHLFVSGCFAPNVPDPDPLHNLPDSELLAELRRLNGMPKEVQENAELLSLMLPTLRADCTITETYSHTEEPPLDFPISAFGGLQDDMVSRHDLEAWRNHTTGSFLLRMFPGDHFFLQTAQPLLLQVLSRELS